MASELIPLVLRAALFAGLAILVLLALRRPLRRWLGAALAYQAWLLVPLAVAASVLPGRPPLVLQSLQVLRPVQGLAAQATATPPSSQAESLLLAWACGAALAALWFVFGQRAFLRQAGRLTRCGDVHLSAGGAGPASVGLFRPKIVVPHDFASRYSPSEQALVIAHERVHIARGDLHANLLAALLQCVFWFNPLVHLGVRRFRQDQELACDAQVMLHHPQQRRTYAEALLKSHTGASAFGAGIHCHWQQPHPAKERIMSLQQTPPGTIRRFAGRCALAVLAAATFGTTVALGARADTALPGYQYAVTWNLTGPNGGTVPVKIHMEGAVRNEGGHPSQPRILVRPGGKFSVDTGEYQMDVHVRQADTPDKVWLATRLFRNKEPFNAPTLLVRVGEAASVRMGDGADAITLSMTVAPYP